METLIALVAVLIVAVVFRAITAELGALRILYHRKRYGYAAEDAHSAQRKMVEARDMSTSLVLTQHEFNAFRATTNEVIEDDRVCSICDGGPGNNSVCVCGHRQWERDNGNK